MNRAEVEDVVSRIKYKPNFNLFVSDSNLVMYGWLDVVINMRVPCSRNPGEVAKVTGIVEVYDYIEEMLLVEMVFHRIRSLEQHEVGEWFRYDGTLFSDPHSQKYSLQR